MTRTSPTRVLAVMATPQVGTAASATSTPFLPTSRGDAVLVGAGDIASCGWEGDEGTARLLDEIEGTVFTLGDNAYGEGTSEQFEECYGPTWGRHKDRTRPAAGNHEYRTDDAAPYFEYFGDAAGEPGKGYYSYDAGTWRVIVLNSNCGYVGGCDQGSPQYRWLQAELAAHARRCTLAYWHHPLFSGGKYRDEDRMHAVWEQLYDAGAEIVLSGHDHNYQRFAPQDAEGRLDLARGLRQFVVGTGGAGHYAIEDSVANLEVDSDDALGVLKLTLRAGRYEWEFIPLGGLGFSDSGSGVCH